MYDENETIYGPKSAAVAQRSKATTVKRTGRGKGELRRSDVLAG